MNLWVRLPEPLDAGELLARAQREGVTYLPGRYFAVSRLDPGALRLSFAGLAPEEIRAGLAILGRTIRAGLETAVARFRAFARHGVYKESKCFQFSNEWWTINVGLAEMLKGGVIMDVTNAEQAKIAEDAGASAVMALERVPSDIRKEGGVARMANIAIMEEIQKTVTIPVMAKARIGHFVEAQHPGSAQGRLHRRERSPHPRRRRDTTSIRTPSRRPSSAARATWARPCAASPKARP